MLKANRACDAHRSLINASVDFKSDCRFHGRQTALSPQEVVGLAQGPQHSIWKFAGRNDRGNG